MKYEVWAEVTGLKLVGEVEADSEEEAYKKARADKEIDSEMTCVNLCYQCADEIEGPEMNGSLHVEPKETE